MIRLRAADGLVVDMVDQVEDTVAAELGRVANRAARWMEQSAQTMAASAGGGTLTAQGGGQPWMNLDDLVIIGAEWWTVVDRVLVPMLEQLYRGVHLAWSLAVNQGLPGWGTAVVPPVRNQLAEVRLEEARNRLRGIGDALWEDARAGLLDGFTAGEGIPELADRVRQAAGVTTPRATLIARTEVISVSNGGAIDTARSVGVEMEKEWMSTPGEPPPRPSHRAANEQRRALDDPFEVGDASLDFPGDPSGPIEEIANCRCTVGWVFPDDPPPPPVELLPGDDDMTLTAAARQHTGAMVALVPADDDAARLAVEGGEPAEELHLTLAYLGEAVDLGPDAWSTIRQLVADQVDGLGPVEGTAFAVSAFNPGAVDRDTALVVGVDGDGVLDAHRRVSDALAGFDGTLPEQHVPWVAHVTLAYDDDLSRLGTLVDRLGPVRFDRVRLAWAGHHTDLPLSDTGSTPPGGPGSDDEPSVTSISSPVEVTAAVDTPSTELAAAGDAAAGEVSVSTPADTVVVTGDEPEPETVEHFHAVMIVEGVSTGMRTFSQGALTWRQPPFAFRWQKTEPETGGHGMSVHVGNIERVERRGDEIHGWGRLDLDSVDGLEFGRKLAAGFAPWVSIGLDEQLRDSDIELVFPETEDEDEGDEDGLLLLLTQPEQIVFHAGRIAELTAVTVPAQQEATVEGTAALTEALTARGVSITASAVDPVADPVVTTTITAEPSPDVATTAAAAGEPAVVASAWTVTLSDLPPAWWFQEPVDVDWSAAAVTITDEGRIFGCVAPAGVAHRGFRDKRIEVPMGRVDYTRWMGGKAMTDNGPVPAGPLTMDCPHLSPYATNDTGLRMEHYEHTCSVVAKAAVGEVPGRGVWMAGALEPGVTAEQLSAMLACRLSGDWGPHPERPGWQELVAALFVPVPAFARGDDGEALASMRGVDGVLTASAVPVRFRPNPSRWRPMMERLARSIGRDRDTRARELRARVHQHEGVRG